MIEAINLSKLYGRGVYALRDLTLRVDKGVFVFLTRIPPFDQRRKLIELHGARLGVGLLPFGESMLIKPDHIRGRTTPIRLPPVRAVKEKQIGRY